tara:strand:- start:1804 stop:2664 length:861 start_codon:yes stop_codon:yes gene_type:complete
MNILLTGDNGQLAYHIKKLKKKNFKVYSASKYNFSSNNLNKNSKLLEKLKIDLIINTKAYTDVERAEKQKTLAYKLNSTFVKKITALCLKKKIFLIHISTDFIFDGKSNKPYSENSNAFPINYYGYTKLLGEKYIKKNLDKYIIIRTSKIYSKVGKNFLKKMIDNSIKKKSLKYLNNEYFCPTHANDLARLIFLLIQKIKKLDLPQIFHFTGDKQFTPYTIVSLILKTLKKMSFKEYAKLNVANIKELNLQAKRPKFSVLDNTKVNNYLNFKRTSIRKIIKSILLK